MRKAEKKTCGCDKDSLIKKEKAVHASKAKRETHSLLLIARQMSGRVLGSRASARIAVIQKANTTTTNIPPSPFP